MRRLLEFHDADGCVRCGSTQDLQRAHVIDRCFGGLDNLANLRPLCRICHRMQPPFGPEQEDEALTWFATPGSPLVAIFNHYLAIEAERRGVTPDELATEWLAA